MPQYYAKKVVDHHQHQYTTQPARINMRQVRLFFKAGKSSNIFAPCSVTGSELLLQIKKLLRLQQNICDFFHQKNNFPFCFIFNIINYLQGIRQYLSDIGKYFGILGRAMYQTIIFSFCYVFSIETFTDEFRNKPNLLLATLICYR